MCKDADKELLGEVPDIEDALQCNHTRISCNRKCTIPCRKSGPLFYNLGQQVWIKLYDFSSLLDVIQKNIDVPYMLVGGNTAKGNKFC